MPTITFNFQYFVDLGQMPFPLIMVRLFLDGGWFFILAVMIGALPTLWLQSRQAKFAATITYTLLAIDVPKMNLQTVKAVEHIFSHFSVAYAWGDKIDKWWHGKITAPISFEIVSIDGYVQFLVRCPSKLRDLIEASFYSQYPDAEIIEVADYVDKVPAVYPDPEWDLFGTELILNKPWVLPIKSHVEFEHTGAEVVFKDPMSSLLESMSMLRRGEQMWLQILVYATDGSWRDKSEEAANKMVGKKPLEKKSVWGEVLWLPNAVVSDIVGILGGSGEGAPEKKPDAQPKMLALTPGEKNVLEGIQDKAAKPGFNCKIRVVYVARRNVFSKGRLSGVQGAFAQYTAQNMNSFRPYGPVMPTGTYFYQRWTEQEKKARLLRNYRNRSARGAPPYILNTEELATIYHFPMEQVKAAQVQKTEAKRGEPPSTLPTTETTNIRQFQRLVKKPEPTPAPKADEKEDEEDEGEGNGPPKNLPFA